MRLIDIHSHLLPGVDDGADTMEEALSLIKQASENGISDLILTPHYILGGEYRVKASKLIENYELLLSKVKEAHLPIQLHLGNELFCADGLTELIEEGRVLPLANSKYVLVEFDFNKYEAFYDDVLYDLMISGYQVIIAHPERYDYVQKDFTFCNKWLKEGYLLQLNQSSILASKHLKSKECALALLKHHYASFVASDAHSIRRPSALKEAYAYVRDFDEEYAKELFCENPLAILENRSICFDKQYLVIKKKNFWSKFLGGK